ncbi:MAG: hypothetical protein NC184_01570 [Roseburia sp.]|nr:hypothetical protein [Roseburia sp.]
MKFIEWLNELVPVAIGVIGVIALIISIVEAYKNWETIKEMFSKTKKGIGKLLTIHRTGKRRKYNRTVSDLEFLNWQKQVLRYIYPFLNNNKNEKKEWEIANAFGYEYEALYFKSKEIQYPFNEIREKQKLGDFPLSIKKKSGKVKVIYEKEMKSKVAKQYYKLLKPTIKFPNNIGYMLDSMEIGEDGFGFSAHPNTYLSNVYTSNVLEYELYLLYKKIYKNRHIRKNIAGEILDVPGKSYYIKRRLYFKKRILYLGDDANEFLLNNLPIRKSIHDKFNDEENILTEGRGRESLLGVQAMVLCKNRRKGYDVLRIRRSEAVDAKAGFLQFIPSGGFSALENDVSHDCITSNFSVSKAILREFLEECFGEEDFSGRKTISTESIYADDIIKRLDPLKNTQNIEFIGTAFSLVSLRHELCFIIKIDDFDVIDRIRNNEECASVIDFISLDKLENEATWNYKFANAQYNDYEKLNPTSAALWNLAKGTTLYNRCKESEN